MTHVPEIDFTPQQEQQLREAMSLEPEDELTPGAVVAFCAAAKVIEDTWDSLWRDGGP